MSQCSAMTRSGKTCCRKMKDGMASHCFQHKHHHEEQQHQSSSASMKGKSVLRGARDVTYQTSKLPGRAVKAVLPKPSPRNSRGIYAGTRDVAVGVAKLPGKIVHAVLY